MMTLLPLTAFAGTAGVFDSANRFATVVTTDKTSLVADGAATVKFTVYVYDEDNDAAGAGVPIYFASKRGTTDVFLNASTGATLTSIGAGAAGDASDYVYTVNTDASGKAEFKVRSSVVGTATIGIGLLNPSAATNVYSHMTGVTGATADLCGFVASKDITFTSPSLNAVSALGVTAGDGSAVAGTGLTSAAAYNSATINGNNVDYYELSVKVVASNGAPVANQEVTFSTNKTDATLSKTTDTTDATGVVKVKVYAAKPGTYKVKASAGDKDLERYFTFAANDLYNIELVSGGNETIAKDADYNIKFKLLDINGNQIKVTGFPTSGAGVSATTIATTPVNTAALNLGLKFEATTRPSDSAIDEKIYNNGATANYEFFTTTEGYLQMRIKAAELDTEGSYVIKAYFDNGKSVEVPFTVKKQGTPVSLTVEYDQASVPINTAVGAPTIKRVDAEGVSKQLSAATVGTDIVFSANDVRKISAAGIAANGSFTTVNDEKYAGDIVITAVDKVKNLVGTATIKLAKTASGLALTLPEGPVNVSTDAIIKAQIVDVDGNAVALGTSATAVTVDYYVISKPSGAIVSTSTPSTILTDMQEKGSADLKVSSNVAGDVKVQIVITTTGAGGPYTKDATITFGEPKPEVTYGAKNVTMFIGSSGFVKDGAAATMDQAPFIQDNRTFVPVRMVGEALGAEVEYDAATQVITLTRPDMTITMTVGSNVLVKSDGTSVVSDVAPFIVAETGRTVIPFRAIAEAFGATVEAVFAADGTVTAVTFQQ